MAERNRFVASFAWRARCSSGSLLRASSTRRRSAAERPFGWLVDEIKAPENCDVSVTGCRKICAYFQKVGTFRRPTIETVIRWRLRAGNDARRGRIYEGENHDLDEMLAELERGA